MPPPLLPGSSVSPDVGKLIDEVFVTQGAAINCAALRRLLQQIASNAEPTGQRPCNCKCAGASRVTIEDRPLIKIPSKPIKPTAAKSGASKVGSSAGSAGAAAGRGKDPKSDSEREHEVILSKLQNVQKMLKEMQQKINKIESRLPKSQSNVSLARGTSGRGRQTSKASSLQLGGGFRRGGKSSSASKIAKKHYCGIGGPSVLDVAPAKLKGSSKVGKSGSGSQSQQSGVEGPRECMCMTRRRMRNASKQ